jgi:hypothetical protein
MTVKECGMTRMEGARPIRDTSMDLSIKQPLNPSIIQKLERILNHMHMM